MRPTRKERLPGRAAARKAAIREADMPFYYLAEQSPSMIWINQGGRIIYANRRSEEIMGYSREELYAPDFDFRRLVAPEFWKQTTRNLAKHFRGEDVPPYEYAVVAKDGRRIEATIATKLIQFNGAAAILGTVTDISQQKRAEARLRKSESELRAQKQSLEQKNAALRELLAQIEAEKTAIIAKVSANAERLLMPTVRKLRLGPGTIAGAYIDLLENNIRKLTSDFGVKLEGGPARLSPRETEVCDMVRNGISSKDIAALMHISVKTVHTLRNRIRRKLALRGKGVNLTTYLHSADNPPSV